MAQFEAFSQNPVSSEVLVPISPFVQKIDAREREVKHVCVGFDPVEENMYLVPGLSLSDSILHNNKKIIDSTMDIAAAFKPNLGFYLAQGWEGIKVLQDTFAYMKEKCPDVLRILDFKVADIGKTAEQWAKFAFDICDVDAVTVNPYLGREALKPFLDRKERGIIILDVTSNPGAGEFQNLETRIAAADLPEPPRDTSKLWAFRKANEELFKEAAPKRLYERVASSVNDNWNENGNCAIVVGATKPEELGRVRSFLAPQLPILVPGVGAQGGSATEVVKHAKHRFLINSSSGIYSASKGADFAERAREEALKLDKEIKDAKEPIVINSQLGLFL